MFHNEPTLIVFLRYPDGTEQAFCRIEINHDFSAYLNFFADNSEIHIHPTGHINFKNHIKNLNETIFLKDPYLYDGMQPIAFYKMNSVYSGAYSYKNDKFEKLIFEITSKDSLIEIAISKFHLGFIDRPFLSRTILDNYNILFFEKRIGTSITRFTHLPETGLYKTNYQVSGLEITEQERFIQSQRLRRKGCLIRHPDFQSLSSDEQAKALSSIDENPIFQIHGNHEIETILISPMRIKPKVIIDLHDDGYEAIEIELSKKSQVTTSVKFKIRRIKGGAYITDLTLIKDLIFDAEIY